MANTLEIRLSFEDGQAVSFKNMLVMVLDHAKKYNRKITFGIELTCYNTDLFEILINKTKNITNDILVQSIEIVVGDHE